MKQSKLKQIARTDGYEDPDTAESRAGIIITRLNEDLNYLASMGYAVLFDTETIALGNGHYFTQITGYGFYDTRGGDTPADTP